MNILIKPMLAEPTGISVITFMLLGLPILLAVIAGIVALIILIFRQFKHGEKKGQPIPPVQPPPVASITQIISRKCPQCGATLQPDVPEGLCPACLLQRVMGTEGGAPPGTPPFVPPTIPELGQLFPQLEILELIGKGGMGAVYKARQPALDRFVALKILAPRSGGDLDFAGRFTREARALARLSHPNIVGVYDFGQTASLSYFIMEFVDGPNLRQAGKLTPRQAMEIIPQICTALQFAHDEGIVHRDIKPENVLLDKKGRVKIADFGLAKILGQEPQAIRLTGAKDIMGTPHYMAPEQVERPQDVDHRADIYSLGVVFYEMLTGELPLGKFQSPSQKVSVDVRLDEVVLRSLAKEPELRYQHVSEIGTRVETIASTPSDSGTASPSAGIKSRGNESGRPLSAGVLAFRRGVRVALWVFGLILAASVVITLLLPKDYVAVALVRLNGPAGEDPYHLQTEFEVMQSAAVLKQAAAAANVVKERGGKRFYSNSALNDEATFVMMKRQIELQPIRNSALVQIGFHSDSPAWSAEVANKIAEAYCSRPSEHAGEIIERAVAPQHPARPNIPLNIFIGAMVGAVLGLLIGGVVGVISFLKAPRPVPDATKPDRFWRKFAVVVLALISIPFVIAIIGMLAAIAIPNFVKARQRAQENARLAAQNPSAHSTADFYTGQTSFPRGDSIEIVAVERTKNEMTVKGHYNLVSADEASLWLNITATNNDEVPNQAEPPQSIHISKGRGDFELSRSHLVPGLPHVSMYNNHHSFADIYFGNQDEAAAESKLDLEPSASAETWSPALMPGEKPDLQKILQDAKKLMDVDHFEEALQRHIWYHNHALEFDQGQSGVRLSFALSDWIELGRRYPKAKQALIEIRDNKTRELAEGRGYSEMFQEVAAINHELQNDDATYTLFKTLRQKDPKLAQQCYFFAESLLVSKGEYQWCFDHMGSPQQRFDLIRQLFDMQRQNQKRMAEMHRRTAQQFEETNRKNGRTNAWSPPDTSDMMERSAIDRFVGQTRQLIEILVATNHRADAEKIRDQAVAILDDARLKSAVSDAEEKIQNLSLQNNNK